MTTRGAAYGPRTGTLPSRLVAGPIPTPHVLLATYDITSVALPPPPALSSVYAPKRSLGARFVFGPPLPAVIYPAVYTPRLPPVAVFVAPPLPLFRVLFWTPLASNVARVFLSLEPLHKSVLGENDAMNRLNWVISLVDGPGTTPIIEQVENPQPQPDLDPGTWPRAWSVDLRLDRPILVTSTYLIVASSAIEAAVGVMLEPPPFDRGEAAGDMPVQPRRAPPSVKDGLDYRYDTFAGVFSVDSRGDVDVHGGDDYLRKRVIRRLISTPGGFFHLRNYGVGLRVKQVQTTTDLSKLQRLIERQVLAEDDVASVQVTVTVPVPGALAVVLRVQSKTGSGFTATLEVPDIGPVVLS